MQYDAILCVRHLKASQLQNPKPFALPSSFGTLGANVELVPYQVVLSDIVSVGCSWLRTNLSQKQTRDWMQGVGIEL